MPPLSGIPGDMSLPWEIQQQGAPPSGPLCLKLTILPNAPPNSLGASHRQSAAGAACNTKYNYTIGFDATLMVDTVMASHFSYKYPDHSPAV
ncbi:hypothetical protein [uncultured Pontibacter sp.]|uniref:hypothetical protein n=1 Tax=uncultured Pontibacter sp. TaxID=453356 RepID=UPI00260A99C5|nr:hypothetical protein [uncultured Pontibacter sp.]